MLSDHEQRTLRELEASITAEDPRFARSLHDRQEHMSRGRRQLTSRIVFVIAAVLGLGALVAGSVAGAAALVAATVLAWSMWRSAERGQGGVGNRRR